MVVIVLVRYMNLMTSLFHLGKTLGKAEIELAKYLRSTMMAKLGKTKDIRFLMDRKLGRVGTALTRHLRKRMCQLFQMEKRLGRVGTESVRYLRLTTKKKYQHCRMGRELGMEGIALVKYLKSPRKKKTRHQFHSQYHSGLDIRLEKALNTVGK